MLGAATALMPWASFPAWGEDQSNDPTSARQQPGDRLVFLTGPKKGQAPRSADLELGGPQAQAYPADPKGRRARRSTLNFDTPWPRLVLASA
jgi:hypothetical protein